MSSNWPYTSERIPVEISETRLRFVRKLELIYAFALDQRINYCKEHGIKYLHGICEPSPDAETERLDKAYLSAHVEAKMLELKINTIKRKLHMYPYCWN